MFALDEQFRNLDIIAAMLMIPAFMALSAKLEKCVKVFYAKVKK